MKEMVLWFWLYSNQQISYHSFVVGYVVWRQVCSFPSTWIIVLCMCDLWILGRICFLTICDGHSNGTCALHHVAKFRPIVFSSWLTHPPHPALYNNEGLLWVHSQLLFLHLAISLLTFDTVTLHNASMPGLSFRIFAKQIYNTTDRQTDGDRGLNYCKQQWKIELLYSATWIILLSLKHLNWNVDHLVWNLTERPLSVNGGVFWFEKCSCNHPSLLEQMHDSGFTGMMPNTFHPFDFSRHLKCLT